MTPQEYIDILQSGRAAVVEGLFGRIIRGKTPEDFTNLTDDPNRVIVMLTDSAGLASFFSCPTHRHMLLKIGHAPDHIERQVTAGKTYQLVVFPATEGMLGDWDGIFTLTKEAYPSLAPVIEQHAETLRNTSYADLEAAAGYQFKTVDQPDNDRFLSFDRLKDIASPTAWQLRAFLYHVLHLREQYSGDGFTYDDQGRQGVREYIIRNKPISDIPGAVRWDMNVQL